MIPRPGSAKSRLIAIRLLIRLHRIRKTNLEVLEMMAWT